MERGGRFDGEVGAEDRAGVVGGGIGGGGGREETVHTVGGLQKALETEAGEGVGHVGCCVCGLQG